VEFTNRFAISPTALCFHQPVCFLHLPKDAAVAGVHEDAVLRELLRGDLDEGGVRLLGEEGRELSAVVGVEPGSDRADGLAGLGVCDLDRGEEASRDGGGGEPDDAGDEFDHVFRANDVGPVGRAAAVPREAANPDLALAFLGLLPVGQRLLLCRGDGGGQKLDLDGGALQRGD